STDCGAERPEAAEGGEEDGVRWRSAPPGVREAPIVERSDPKPPRAARKMGCGGQCATGVREAPIVERSDPKPLRAARKMGCGGQCATGVREAPIVERSD